MLDFSKKLLIQLAVWYYSHGNRSKTALRACSSSGLEKQSTFVSYSHCHQMTGPWDPRDLVAVEPSLCPSIFRDLAESGPLESEAAPVSSESQNLHVLCDVRIHPGHPIRNRRNLRDLRFKVYKFREESIELFIRCAPRAGAH